MSTKAFLAAISIFASSGAVAADEEKCRHVSASIYEYKLSSCQRDKRSGKKLTGKFLKKSKATSHKCAASAKKYREQEYARCMSDDGESAIDTDADNMARERRGVRR